MSEIKPGQRVRGGDGARGRVIRVENPENSPFASNASKEQIFVDWFVPGDDLHWARD